MTYKDVSALRRQTVFHFLHWTPGGQCSYWFVLWSLNCVKCHTSNIFLSYNLTCAYNTICSVNILPSSVENCDPEVSFCPTSVSILSEGSLCDLAAVLYIRGSVSPFWSLLWGTLNRVTQWGPLDGWALYVMALLILCPKGCFPAPAPTFFCLWVDPEPPLPIPKAGPTLIPTAGPIVLFFFRVSDRALEFSVTKCLLVVRGSPGFFWTLGCLCKCRLELLNWSINSSQCSRWCSGSQVSSLLP